MHASEPRDVCDRGRVLSLQRLVEAALNRSADVDIPDGTPHLVQRVSVPFRTGR